MSWPGPGAVLFDLDGTLIDSRADLATGVNLTRRDLGLPPLDPVRIVDFVGEGVRKLLARALPECPERLEEALAINHRHYSEHLLDETRLYPGAIELLERLRGRGWKLAVVTNKPQAFSEAILEGLQVGDHLDAVIGGGGGPLKPDPAPLLSALETCHSPAETSWMVGDHFTDLEAGRRAGLRRCFCRFGFGNPRGESWDLAIEALGDLEDHL